jgi:hypothetical protein
MQTSQVPCIIDGITFTYGENDCQIYWETEHCGIYYALIRPKKASYWALVALGRKLCRSLNTAVQGEDGRLDCDPLYSPHPLTEDGWLALLADHLNHPHKYQKYSIPPDRATPERL